MIKFEFTKFAAAVLDVLNAYPALFALLMAVLLIVATKLAFLAVGHLRFVIRRLEIDAICRATEREWQELQRNERAERIHRVARSIVHPDDPKAA